MNDLSQSAQLMQAKLLRKYLASIPAKRARIDSCWQQVRSSDWSVEGLSKLRIEVHRLAGSAGSYGLEELGAASSGLEASLKLAVSSPQRRDEIILNYGRLEQALDNVVNKKA